MKTLFGCKGSQLYMKGLSLVTRSTKYSRNNNDSSRCNNNTSPNIGTNENQFLLRNNIADEKV